MYGRWDQQWQLSDELYSGPYRSTVTLLQKKLKLNSKSFLERLTIQNNVCVCVCVYVCMYVCMYVCKGRKVKLFLCFN
jgi:hypothetical protein